MNSFPFATSRMASEETPTIVQHAIYVNRMKSDVSIIIKLSLGLHVSIVSRVLI